ncbi:chromatin modification-related protein VID21 [Marasmius crinis-equi]|uniref:Vacuolar import and degradation protein 21 n=1 Tax=Marasmius crinis-equi TaxID=585013 RepID=A0ABR3F7W2_9AGAR
MPENPETLVEQRIAQLETISERRNALLREMYHLLKKRENVGTVLDFNDGEEGDLHVFLNRFDMKTNPQSGYFSSLPENDLFALVAPSPAPSGTPSHSPSVENAEPALSSASRRPSLEVVVSKERSKSPGAPPPVESDDELDLIGPSAPLSPHSSPRSTHSDRIEISNPPEQEQVILIGEDRGEDESANAVDGPSNYETPLPVRTPELVEEVMPIATPAIEIPVEVERPLAESETLEPSIELDTVPSALVETKEADDMEVDRDGELSAAKNETVSPPPQELPTQDQDHTIVVDNNDGMVVDTTPERVTVQVTDMKEASPGTPPPPPVERRDVQEATVRPLDLFVRPVDSTPEPFIEQPPPAPVFVPFPSSSYHSWDGVQFPADFVTDKNQPAEIASSPSRVRFNVGSEYPLPPIKSLPLEFNPNKKGKYAKQRRKEREKAEKAGGQVNKEEWTPWGFNRWIITIKTNPLYKRVSKSTKCLTTRDWGIAMNELKLLRTAERVEYLKAKGRWSFRQPKKQRGMGGSAKTHWDYLLEEMKWMRTDFREERKWKMAVAYNLSTAVLEWHAASSLEERVKKGICVLWKPPRHNTQPVDEAGDVEMISDSQEHDNENTGSQPSPEKSIVDYGSDEDEDDDQDKEQDPQSVAEALDDAARLDEALALQEAGQTEDLGLKDLEPKKEEIDDPHALEDDSMAGGAAGLSTQSQSVQKTEPISAVAHTGLKSTSNDPVLGTKSHTHSSEPTNQNSKSVKRNLYASIREQVAYTELDKLFLDLDDFHISSSEDSQDNQLPQPIPPPSDLYDIFPDMQPYGMLDVAPVAALEGKKKSDKKSEQDPHKRIDDTERTKLMPASKFMYTKPTLIGALDPAHHFKDGQWIPFEDMPITVEYEGPPMRAYSEEFTNKLFDHKPTPIQIVTPAFPSTSQGPQSPTKDKLKEKRSLDHLWSASDDTLLRSLIDKYPNSWELIAECFNATRKAVATDVRTSRDCQERWRELWEQEQGRQRLESALAAESTPPPVSTSTGMATRGVKRLASASVSSTTGPSIGSEPKRRRRHILIQDTIRKAVKKRAEAAQKANVKKPSVLHDTHLQFNKLQKFSPAELSRMKVEQELRQTQELQLRSRMGSQQGRPIAGQPQAPQAVPVASAAPANGVTRAPTAAQPITTQPVVPAIRTQQQAQVPISQQQRAATPLIAGQARMSPPQQHQQQHQQLLQQAQQQQPRPQQPQAPTTQQQQILSQQQALAAALAQVQAQNVAAAAAAVQANGGGSATNATSNVNGTATAAQNTHLPAAYAAIANASRDATSSPAHTSPPPSRTSATPVSVSSPAQPQTQPLQPQQQNGQVGVVGMPRANIQYWNVANVANLANYSPEQVQMLMMQMYQHQAQQAQQQAQQQQQQQQQQQHHQQQQQHQHQQQAGQQQNAGFNSNAAQTQ